MNFIEYSQYWVQQELAQAKLMMAFGAGFLVLLYFIQKSQNELLRGATIPLILLVLILIGYGGYIMYSRPAHSRQSIELYEQNPEEALVKEKEKHINDNKIGNANINYAIPILLTLLSLSLLWISSPYYRGMVLGFILLFVVNYILDSGFVSRSNAFISFLNTQ